VNLLTIVTFLPVLGALALALVPRDEPRQHRALAFVISLVTMAASFGLWFGFDASPGAPEFQFEQLTPWIPSIGIGYHVGLDGVALLLVMLTTILTPIVILSAFKAVQDRVKEFMIALLVLETEMIGPFAALDLVLFYVFWELILVPMYLLIGIWGSQNRLYATVKFFVYTFAASVLMLLAIIYVYFHDGGTFDYVEARRALQVSPVAARWLFAAFALAFAVKVPMFPLHTWLPDAHTEAPTAGSVILAGVLLKMGTFGFSLQHFQDIVYAEIPQARRFMHPDMIFNRISDQLGLVFPPAFLNCWHIQKSGRQKIDFAAWIKQRKMELISISDEEQQKWGTSLITLEPNHVINYDISLKPATQRVLESMGVRFTQFHPDALLSGGGSLRCLTLRLLRE
jgi:NADH:ubiquinone oxidoreductase subunit 2 (subunit N)